MKLVLFVCILLILFGGVFSFRFLKQKILSDITEPIKQSSSLSPTPLQSTPTKDTTLSIFVPYWAISQLFSEYSTAIYFGVASSLTGIDREEQGYKNLSVFMNAVSDKQKKYLTLRMLDGKENFAIIENDSSSRQLIGETVALAKEHDFDGVVLDFEVAAVPFESVVTNITNFARTFAKSAHKEGLHFAVTIYGDTFYRIRPFDVKAIGKDVDEVMVMAYDFHKSKGNPGPNFPLEGRKKYGYDFEQMLGNFTAVIPARKLTIISGMFGYDWAVDGENQAIAVGKPMTFLEVENKLLSCFSCILTRDELSQEQFISYTDNGVKHVVWFEDKESVEKKRSAARKRGISSFSFWANSYF